MPAIMIGIGLANAGQGIPYSPAIVQGLTAWWDASDAGSVTLNSADVASIADKSGNTRSAAQVTAGEQPEYSLAAINSRNAILFTGANNDGLILSNSLGLMRNKPGNTVVGVARIPTLGSVQRLITVLSSSGGGSLYALQASAANALSLTTRRVQADTASGLSSTATISADTPFFFAASVDYATGAVFLQINATTRTQTAGWTVGAASEDLNHSAAPTIGRNGANVISGYIAEMASYGRALSAQEISDLRTLYLKPKWGLA